MANLTELVRAHKAVQALKDKKKKKKKKVMRFTGLEKVSLMESKSSCPQLFIQCVRSLSAFLLTEARER